MRIGPLRNRITFQQKTETPSISFGGVKTDWADVKTVYAQATAMNAAETIEQKQPVASVYTEFRIREPRGFTINEKMRILHKSKYYYITGIKPANPGDNCLINAVLKDNG